MKFYKVLISLLAISFAACGSDDTPNPNPPTPEPPVSSNERTVLIYIAAENSLNKFSTDDLIEMKQGSKALKDNQNLVVYVDQKGSGKPYYARIKDGMCIDSVSVEETSSSDPAVLEEALRYTREKYQAKSHMDEHPFSCPCHQKRHEWREAVIHSWRLLQFRMC